MNIENEVWKSVKGFDNYEASNFGRIRCLKSNGANYTNIKILKPQKRRHGYLSVWLYENGKKTQVSVHKVVANAFHDNPLGFKEVNHKNEFKWCNCMWNLEFCDRKYNVHYGTGIKRSSEHRKGLVPSEETRRKISESKLGSRNPMFGKKSTHRKKVIQLDIDGNVISIFESIGDASSATGIERKYISRCCNMKNKTAGGFKFMFQKSN